MYFIILLLKSKNPTTKILYDSIIVVINKFKKYIYFILFKKTFDTEQLKYLFINLNHIILKCITKHY